MPKALHSFAVLCMIAVAACNSTTETSVKPMPPSASFKVLSKKSVSLTPVQRELVESAVSFDLRDPDSARFRGMRAEEAKLSNGVVRVSVCGEVNAKNAFGAYVGFRPFGAILLDGKSHMSGILSEEDFIGKATAELVCNSF